jgi:hypothetical protein
MDLDNQIKGERVWFMVKIIQGIVIVISILAAVSLFFVRYLSDRHNISERQTEQPVVALASDNLPDNFSIPELMDALNIYHVEEPWEAPDFDLDSLEGEVGSLSQYRDKHVLLTFWTTW